MNPFDYTRADTLEAAVGADGAILAGGTNLLDLMKIGVATPSRLVDISRLPLREIDDHDGGLRIGAMVSNADLARDPRILARFPAVAEALLSGASPQLRNAASTGGNVMQATRCSYFQDPLSPCNRREPGSGCSAIGGVTRNHAILGWSDACIATHPSDLCVALAAFDAVVHVAGPTGTRSVPMAVFHPLPDAVGVPPALSAEEVITHVTLPDPGGMARHARYLKLRERTSYAFAIVSAAAGGHPPGPGRGRGPPVARPCGRGRPDRPARVRGGLCPRRRAGGAGCRAVGGQCRQDRAGTADRPARADAGRTGHARSDAGASRLCLRRRRPWLT